MGTTLDGVWSRALAVLSCLDVNDGCFGKPSFYAFRSANARCLLCSYIVHIACGMQQDFGHAKTNDKFTNTTLITIRFILSARDACKIAS